MTELDIQKYDENLAKIRKNRAKIEELNTEIYNIYSDLGKYEQWINNELISNIGTRYTTLIDDGATRNISAFYSEETKFTKVNFYKNNEFVSYIRYRILIENGELKLRWFISIDNKEIGLKFTMDASIIIFIKECARLLIDSSFNKGLI